jgi:hypothetical protein
VVVVVVVVVVGEEAVVDEGMTTTRKTKKMREKTCSKTHIRISSHCRAGHLRTRGH